MELKHLIVESDVFGKSTSITGVVEFQKRGLPHIHMLLALTEADTPRNADAYDRFVCAEIPPEDKPILRKAVLQHMVHGPCGVHKPHSPCMENKKCTKNFPKEFVKQTTDAADSYPEYRRRKEEDGGLTAILNEGKRSEVKIDNSWIVPFNAALLKRFDCHINVEIVTSIGCLKYLFKYIHKGEDMTAVAIEADHRGGVGKPPVLPEEKGDVPDVNAGTPLPAVAAVPAGQRKMPVDEVTAFRQARYISPIEACFKLF